ncbi:FixH family protein [Herpetosiphon sp. NSE202]|uniref:FixH family protein n=1 Tax=Herpetosiphon sp. NSE202 TaxID=3351349 RepID=UPI00363D8BF1
MSLIGCSRTPSDDQRLTMSLEQTPSAMGVQTIVLVINDGTTPLDNAKVQLEATMTHAGMPSQIVQMQALGAGKYQASIDFSMLGEWVLIVNVTEANGAVMQRTLPAFTIQ